MYPFFPSEWDGGTSSLLDYQSTTASSSATNFVYQIWVRQQTIATTTITTRIWDTWAFNQGCSPVQHPRYGDLARVEPAPLPHDAHVQLARRIERERAEERADELLMSLLSPDQLRQYRAAKCFEVYTKSGRRFRLTRAISGSIKLVGPDGRAMATYCAHLADRHIPVPDHLIAQKFLLEHHEEEFLRIANRS